MNPPYSHGIERGHDSRTGGRHLRSAWKRLLPGGRLVAVMPEWFELPQFLAGIAGPLSLRLNATIERGFVKPGTSISTPRSDERRVGKACVSPCSARCLPCH